MSWLLLLLVGIAAGLVYVSDEKRTNDQLNMGVVVWLAINALLFSTFNMFSTIFGLLVAVVTLVVLCAFVVMNFGAFHRIAVYCQRKLTLDELADAKHEASHLMETAEVKLLYGRAEQKLADVTNILQSEHEVRSAERKRDLAKVQRDAEYADIGRDATFQMRQHVIDLVKARKEEKMLSYLTRIVEPVPEDDAVVNAQPARNDPLEKLLVWYNEGRARQTYLQSVAPDSLELKELEQALEPVHRTLVGAGRL